MDRQPRFVQQCHELSLSFLALLDEPGARQRSKALEELLDRCVKMWGAKPAVLSGVISYADQRRVSPSSSPFDFFDETVSLVKRIRAARARRNEKGWWREQFERGPTGSSRNLLMLVHFRYGSLAAVAECGQITGPILDALPQDAWSSLRSFFDDTFSDDEKSERLNIEEVESSIGSTRALCLLAIRSSSTLAMKFFLEHCVDRGGELICGPRLRQLWALDAILANKLDWNKGCLIIAETYAEGAWNNISYKLQPGRMTVPPNIAEEILQHPDVFPHAVWESAERTATFAARKAVRAVGSVAKSDKWFMT
jgi:hypothetical protein